MAKPTYIEFHVVNGQHTPFPDGVDPKNIKQVWYTLPGYISGETPRVHYNAWPEDPGNDWRVSRGEFKYFTNQTDRGKPALVLLEMK